LHRDTRRSNARRHNARRHNGFRGPPIRNHPSIHAAKHRLSQRLPILRLQHQRHLPRMREKCAIEVRVMRRHPQFASAMRNPETNHRQRRQVFLLPRAFEQLRQPHALRTGENKRGPRGVIAFYGAHRRYFHSFWVTPAGSYASEQDAPNFQAAIRERPECLKGCLADLHQYFRREFNCERALRRVRKLVPSGVGCSIHRKHGLGGT